LVYPRLRVSSAREIASFGAAVSLSSLVYTAFRNIDYALVGARLGPAALGFYWRAYQLGVEYQGKITIVMQRVSFPVYSRSVDLEAMRRFRLRIARIHAIVILPLLGVLVVTAPVAIPFLFGNQWRASVVPTQILAVAGMGAALSAGVGPLFIAAGRPAVLLLFNSVAFVVYGSMIYALAPFGLNTVCVAVAVYTILSTIALYAVMGRVLGVQVRSFAGEIMPAVASTAILIGAAWPVMHALAGEHALVGLAGGALVGTVAYALALKYLFPAAFGDVMLIVGRLVQRFATSST
jgi:O-antigen/teichoic acid export membrane protein